MAKKIPLFIPNWLIKAADCTFDTNRSTLYRKGSTFHENGSTFGKENSTFEPAVANKSSGFYFRTVAEMTEEPRGRLDGEDTF